ncbi:hypothetical protein [Saccharothrix sp. ST-888]|uniref:hypothetical protein n=1 Tax=Saccharothrix sp. ST-888 TaxID=1427391 RepID=UPI0005ED37AC|nr:hypothetical protein [Saccharothrix sp. ST-888]
MDGDGDFFGESAEGLEPDEWLWVRGVDYAAGWREAHAAAGELNVLLAGCGVERWQLRAIADTDAQGRGVVRLEGVAAGWLRLEELLAQAAEVGREAA